MQSKLVPELSTNRFDELFQLAAKWDCLHILEFYCENLFDHDRVGALTVCEQNELADAAEVFIFMECVEQGYQPTTEPSSLEAKNVWC